MLRSILLMCALAATVSLAASHGDLLARFNEFKLKYNRAYKTPEEERKRFAIFASNMRTAERLGKRNPLATFGMNEFADMSAAEFKVRHSIDKFYKKQKVNRKVNNDLVTKEMVLKAQGRAIDWRTKGAVTPIKNQGQCGSCWSFGTTGNIEGQWFMAGNPLTSVSEQELVSCDTLDYGCNGGLPDNAMTWLLQAEQGNIVTEASYPYVSGNGNVPACNMAGTVVGATINGWQNLPTDENVMAGWVYQNGPLTIGVDATSFQTYTSGILTNCISNQIDHAVLIVGFDDNNNPPYWIIKNSWGTSWGENGYIRVEKGTDQCLLDQMVSTSQVAGGPTTTGSGPAPTWTSTPSNQPPYVIYSTGVNFPTPPPGYTQTSLSDITSAAFVSYYNANGLTDLSEQMDGCCIFNLTDGFLMYDGSYVGPYTNQGQWQCQMQLSNPVMFGTAYGYGPAPGQYIGQFTPQVVSMLTANPVFHFNSLGCQGATSNVFAVFKLGNPPPPPGNTFQELRCSDDQCQNCQSQSYPQNQCIPDPNGQASFIATCIINGLLIQEYNTSNCQGPYQQVVTRTNQCSIVFRQNNNFEWLEYTCGAGPGPQPTTTATTPAPTGWNTFMQEQCQDPACSVGCTNYTFQQNVCLSLSGGGSAIVACNSQGVLLTEYSTSDCSGPGQADQMATFQCLQGNGMYFENLCLNTQAPHAAQALNHGRKVQTLMKKPATPHGNRNRSARQQQKK